MEDQKCIDKTQRANDLRNPYLICSVEDPEDQGLGQEPVLSNGDQVDEKPAANEDAIARLTCGTCVALNL